jgi:glycosyltransferase involved in cell wall biosynthesis
MPAVASRTTANLAYFSDANVEFFEPGNVDDLARCIRELYHSPEHMAELARGSQNFNRRYNWSKISEEYVSLVDHLRLGNQPDPG